MSVSTRKKTEIAARQASVAHMYLVERKAQAEIAVYHSVSQSTVSRDLAALRERWLASALVDLDVAKGEELARIDALELEYWAAWQRSKEPTVINTKKAMSGGVGKERKEATERTEQNVGHPAYLAGVQWCIAKRCQILGLDAPKKVEGSGDDGAFLIRLDV